MARNCFDPDVDSFAPVLVIICLWIQALLSFWGCQTDGWTCHGRKVGTGETTFPLDFPVRSPRALLKPETSGNHGTQAMQNGRSLWGFSVPFFCSVHFRYLHFGILEEAIMSTVFAAFLSSNLSFSIEFASFWCSNCSWNMVICN